MNVRPLHDRIIVHRLGGRRTADRRNHHPAHGQREAAAGHSPCRRQREGERQRKRIPLDVKAGDRILFGKYSGPEIKLDGQEYLIMKEDDVLAVIEDKAKKKTKKTTTKKSKK